MSDISRRNLLKGAAVSAVSISAMGLLGACAAPSEPKAETTTDPSADGAGTGSGTNSEYMAEVLEPTSMPDASTASNFNIIYDSKTTVGTTYENLMTAIAGETGATTKYEAFSKVAKNEGFDVLARIMYGGRISLMVGFVVVFLECFLGIIMGGLAGYYGGWVDNLIMRLVDVFYCLPSMPIMIILGAMMDAMRMDTYVRLIVMMAALGLMGWAGVARLVRGQILSLREQEFMVATEATGIRVNARIFRHLVPNVMPQLIVIATMGVGGTILTESTLSFLGLGVKHPLATWGTIINSVSSASAMAHYAFIWIPVGLLICLTVIAFNFVGDGLRDAYDPKAKR